MSLSPPAHLVDQVIARLAGERLHLLERLSRLLRAQAAGHELAAALAAELLAAHQPAPPPAPPPAARSAHHRALAVANSTTPHTHAVTQRRVEVRAPKRVYDLDEVNAILAHEGARRWQNAR